MSQSIFWYLYISSTLLHHYVQYLLLLTFLKQLIKIFDHTSNGNISNVSMFYLYCINLFFSCFMCQFEFCNSLIAYLLMIDTKVMKSCNSHLHAEALNEKNLIYVATSKKFCSLHKNFFYLKSIIIHLSAAGCLFLNYSSVLNLLNKIRVWQVQKNLQLLLSNF